MATYAIGDIHGCFDELQQLLTLIQYNPACDRLWFAGDLVNRGPKSLDVLRFARQTPTVSVVLGNHDLHLLALVRGVLPKEKSHALDAILRAPDCEDLMDWLRRQPLLHHDPVLGYTMVHAGIAPQWSLSQAKQYAQEVELVLRSDQYIELLASSYGNHPHQWDEQLRGLPRLSLIIHYFTRMRFCDVNGGLKLYEKGALDKSNATQIPWFQMTNRPSKACPIIFGHWAALLRKNNERLRSDSLAPHLYALDGGCAWGGDLIAMRLEDRQFFNLHCALQQRPLV